MSVVLGGRTWCWASVCPAQGSVCHSEGPRVSAPRASRSITPSYGSCPSGSLRGGELGGPRGMAAAGGTRDRLWGQWVSGEQPPATDRQRRAAPGYGMRNRQKGQRPIRRRWGIRFSELPRQAFPDGATPEEITRHSMDLSYALQRVMEQRYPDRPLGLLAELQFAFICFLIGNVYDAFEHWKRLLNILCRSEEAMGKYQDLYINLISVLYHQLNEIPADFFVDIVSQDNFLTSTLQVLFSCTCSSAVDEALRKKAEKFKAHLTKKFKWDFEAEPDDCAPVVVELPEGVGVGGV
uniref:Protein AAR2 homolog n=1 Tax=Zosterops lateralis melanops TaxID=1220523 RepID=A0A8D2PW48_ZOSLA